MNSPEILSSKEPASSLPTPPPVSVSSEEAVVSDEPGDEVDESKLQVLWSEIMDKGRYKNSSRYKKAAVLLLCWDDHSNDLNTKGEVEGLKSVFEKQFRYIAKIEYLQNRSESNLQVQVNCIVASFVKAHDGPHTLLIVYYAGHGKPGSAHGDLECFGQTSPNDTVKRKDKLVWNKVEYLLKDATADVLEILDCCYAGTLSLTRGEERIFEFLAATKVGGLTNRSGPTSFTSALIWSLEKLAEKKDRFTTVDLRRTIIHDAPEFPKDQEPQLSDRQMQPAGHIMLHPLSEGESCNRIIPEVRRAGSVMQPTVTLHFDYEKKPTEEQIETLGLGLNKIFEEHNLGVNGVRWGGMQVKFARWAKKWIEGHRQRKSINLGEVQNPMNDGVSNVELNQASVESITSSSAKLESPGRHHFIAEGEIVIGPSECGQDRHKRRRLSHGGPASC